MVRTVLTVSVILLASIPAMADTVTVSQTMTYANNTLDVNGPFFVPRGWILDHDYRRGAWQDWGWTHNMSSLRPADAIGVAGATLIVRDWDVADGNDNGTMYPEEDRIYAIRTTGGTLQSFVRDGETPADPFRVPVTLIGKLAQTGVYEFGTTTLPVLNAGVLDQLGTTGSLRLFMDIDALFAVYGHQVTLVYSTLNVDYVVPHATWEPNLPVYRFYSKKTGAHFYTTSEGERVKLKSPSWAVTWDDEGLAYHTYAQKRQNTGGTLPVVSPVYRFWSSKSGTHFYTISEGEKDKLMAWCTVQQAKTVGISSTWAYEGIAFYAHAAGQQPEGSKPVYRFWSTKLGQHFYTASEGEKNKVQQQMSDTWSYEGIAWYAYQ
jgi:hypothetical protein